MTPREKILAIAVGGLLLILGLNYVFSTYREALDSRRDRVNSLQSDVEDKEQLAIAGAMADAEIAELRKRSLPSSRERAQSFYQEWLLGLVREVQLASPTVDFQTVTPRGDLYHQYRFRVSGQGNLQQLADLMFRFHNQDFLHRIQKVVIQTRGEDEPLTVTLDIEAISLNDASPTQTPASGPTPRVQLPKEAYVDAIINRNPFSPPNQAPQFVASSPDSAYIGQDFRYVAKFDDPEGHYVQYELVGDAPSWLELDAESGALTGRPEEEGDYAVTVRAVDDGLPSRASEHELQLSVKPPPEEPVEETPPTFDDAEQTFLTGIVQSGGEWQAWIKVRTTGETLFLSEGDTLEVGDAKGTIVEINYRYVVLETEDRRWTLRQRQSLAEAFQAGQED